MLLRARQMQYRRQRQIRMKPKRDANRAEWPMLKLADIEKCQVSPNRVPPRVLYRRIL